MTSSGSEQHWPLGFSHAVARCFVRSYHQVTVTRPCRLPRHRAAILASNHTSSLDALIIHGICPRSVVWMMAKEYYDMKTLNWIYRMIQAIPVQRSGRDLRATRAALRALADGRVLGMFPEGKISPTGDLLPFQTGAAMMAIRTGVDVYPLYVEGTQRGKDMAAAVLQSQRARIAFGGPVEFDRSSSSREALEAATARIQAAVAALRL